MPLIFEFKAKSNCIKTLEQKLQELEPRFAGEDHQTDTYFNVRHGRLKLREGNIENALIHYNRNDIAGAKPSNVLLYKHQPDNYLKAVLTAALGIKIIVEKTRRIWFVQNVKIHFDKVEGLGEFIEVEAIDEDGSLTIKTLREQCLRFAGFFAIKQEQYVSYSYSDLLLKQ